MKTLFRSVPVVLPIMIFILLGSITETVMADTRYVSDVLIISVREGQSPDDAIIGYIRSATPLSVLEETEELLHIQTPDGLQGWVKKRFVVKEKPKDIIIQELKDQIAFLGKENSALQEDSGGIDLKNMMQSHQKEITALKTTLKKEKNRLSALQGDNKDLKAKNQTLVEKNKGNDARLKELNSLIEENKTLKAQIASLPSDGPPPALSNNMKWFLIGGGVLLFGFIMGRAVKRKRTYRY